MENNFFRRIPTDLDLNGPVLSYTSQPSDASGNATDSVTFTVAAEALFPGDTDPENGGTITYQWYEVGEILLTDGSKFSGVTTPTLTVLNLDTPVDNGRQFYCQIGYTPNNEYGSAASGTGPSLNGPLASEIATLSVLPILEIIAQPPNRVVGENNNTSFAINAGLTDETYLDDGAVTYQWYINDEIVEEGSTIQLENGIFEVIEELIVTTRDESFNFNGSVTLPPGSYNISGTIAGARGGGGGTDVGGSGGAGGSGRAISFILNEANAGNTLNFRIGRSGGGGGRGNQNVGGAPGSSNIGAGGDGGGAGQNGFSGGGGGGGGASGIVRNDGTVLIVAGGGGGGGGASLSRSASAGTDALRAGSTRTNFASRNGIDGVTKNGDGGGGGGGGGGVNDAVANTEIFYVLDFSTNVRFDVKEQSGYHHFLNINGVGTFSENNSNTPYTVQQWVNAGTYRVTGTWRDPFTRETGNSGIRVDPTNLRNVQATDGGGSWDDIEVFASAGRFISVSSGGSGTGSGGGSGTDNVNGGSGGRGGGSRFRSDLVTVTDEFTNGGDGYGNIRYTFETLEQTIVDTLEFQNTTFTGTTTDTLNIVSDNANFSSVKSVYCVISHPTATNSPITSNTVYFTVVDSAVQNKIILETITNTNNAGISEQNLSNSDLTIQQQQSGDIASGEVITAYVLYSPDKDIDVEMDLYGGKGSDNGTFSGGEGGFSRIRFTMEQNVEYVVTGINPQINSPFLYRKGTLIANVGGGGNAGTSGRGGFGGGVGVSGSKGLGRNAGNGGIAVADGDLATDGIFGSNTTLTPVSPDTKAVSPNGGRSIKCTKGVYWKDQGISPCSDVGTVKFRLSDGTVVDDSAEIERGFKAGYNINRTGGKGVANGGNGGNGTTGGNGGQNGSGGGGGSGYTDGSVTVVDTQLGGSTENAKIVLRLAA